MASTTTPASAVAKEDLTVFMQRSVNAGIEALEKVVGSDDTPRVEHLLAQMLFRRNQINDRAEAITLLKGRLNDLHALPESTRVEYVDLLAQIEVDLFDAQYALTSLKSLPPEVLGEREQAII